MKIKWKSAALCVAIPLLVGGLAGFISSGSMDVFSALTKPPLSPPGWLFPVVWTVLYIMMGAASYLIYTSRAPAAQINKTLKLYALQLGFNFLWTFLFFNLQLYYFSFAWLCALWLLILGTIILFSRISKPAGYLLIPYLLWVSFAGYLNLAIAILN